MAKSLGHTSKERMLRLVNNEILPKLNFTDFCICVDYIKGKHVNHPIKKASTSSTQLLEIIHNDICGSFNVSSFSGEKYFITFIDDFSHYGYMYLLQEKSQSVDTLEFVHEVERQLDQKGENY